MAQGALDAFVARTQRGCETQKPGMVVTLANSP